jgi:hypothetical protein
VWMGFLHTPVPILRTGCSPITLHMMDFAIFIMETGYNSSSQCYLNYRQLMLRYIFTLMLSFNHIV